VPEQLVANTEQAVPEGVLVFTSLLGRASSSMTASCTAGGPTHSTSRRSMVYFSYRQAGYAANTHFEAQRSVIVVMTQMMDTLHSDRNASTLK